MGNSYARVRDSFFDKQRRAVNRFNVVVKEVALTSAGKLALHSLAKNAEIVFNNIGLNGIAVAGSLL